MLNVHIFSKKKKKKKQNCDLLPLGSLFLLGLNSALSLSLSLPGSSLGGKEKKGGGGLVSLDSRVSGELTPDLDLSLNLGQWVFSVLFCYEFI